VLRLHIIAVGTLRGKPSGILCEEYAGRIRRYAKLEVAEFRDEPSKALVPKMQKALPKNAAVIALEVGGKALASTEFAEEIDQAQHQAARPLAFLIGGSEGLAPELSRLAHRKLSLSRMTLPHRLARVLLLEQLYRAFAILHHEPYHK